MIADLAHARYPDDMTTALLHLVTLRNTLPLALSALRSGEIDPAFTLQHTPDLLAQCVHAMERNVLNPDDQYELVMYLADAGFDPWTRDEAGKDAFDYALSVKNAKIISWLAAHPNRPEIAGRLDPASGQNPLWGAHLEAAQVLTDIGYSVLDTDDMGRTLLHDTLNPDLIRFLITQGCNPYQKNDAGTSAAQEWDACNLTLDVLRTLDGVLEDCAPRNPQDLIAQFGQQCLNVGGPLARTRLQKAGIQPKTAQINGYGLPEIMTSTLLDKGLRHRREIGDEADIKKGKKAIQSALKMTANVNPDAQTDYMKQVRAIVHIYDTIAQRIAIDHAYLNSLEIEDSDPEAESGNEISLSDLVGKDDDGVLNVILRSVDALEDLYDAGLIENISWISAYFMRSSKASLKSIEDWMTPTRDGTPLFFKLGHLATRHIWDDGCSISKDLITKQAFPQGFDIPAYFYLQAPLIQNGLGIVMTLSLPPQEQTIEAMLRTLLQQGDQTGLSKRDPLLQHGKSHWLEINVDYDAIDQLLEQIDAFSERNDLNRDTHQVSRSSVRRM